MLYKQNTEISALDVAAYIVNYLGEIPTAKLQYQEKMLAIQKCPCLEVQK